MKQSLLLVCLLATTALKAQQAPAPANPAPATELEQERQRWNKMLTGQVPNYVFNLEPNALLVETVRGRAAGTALDVGMGQGRNALYLARLGWQVTGIDIADEAVAQARQQAKAAGLPLTALVQDDASYDFGTARWDLIAFIYAGGGERPDRVLRALKPGGRVVIEAFGPDNSGIATDITFAPQQLRRLYEAAGFVIERHEEVAGVADFKRRKKVPLVKLVASRPR